jgi:hypothetical protein
VTWRPDGMDDDREGTWIAKLGCLGLIVAVLAFAGWAVWERWHPTVSMTTIGNP